MILKLVELKLELKISLRADLRRKKPVSIRCEKVICAGPVETSEKIKSEPDPGPEYRFY